MEYLKSIAFIAQALQEDAAGTGRAGPPPPQPPHARSPIPCRSAFCRPVGAAGLVSPPP